MTIDEAQIMLKAKAKCIERICKGIYEDCNEQKCDNCDLCYAQGTNGEQIELMLQCAEWLEELKVIKEMNLSIPQHFTKEQSDWIKKYCINRNFEVRAVKGAGEMTYHKEEYTLHNGQKIYVQYDDYNICQVTKECIEILIDLYQQGREDAIDDFANWLVEQGILGNRCISDGEITDYGKVYAKKYKEQLKEEDK